MNRRSNSEVCRECGGYCCNFGGTTASRAEHEAILRAGHADHFIHISDNCYVTAWGDDGVCPYLEDSSCSIYELRPLICHKFPIVSFNRYDHYIAHCPLAEQLSEDEISDLITLSLQVPDELLDGSVIYLSQHGEDIDKRIGKFRLVELGSRRTRSD